MLSFMKQLEVAPGVVMKSIWSRAAGVLLAFAVVCSAQAQTQLPTGVERVTSVEGITEYRLANGLRVLLFPDPSNARITVNITYLVGSVDESAGEAGMAHLLEHMVFKGTPTHRNILKEIQDRGAQVNGTTAWERTNYFETFDASDENLEWALELEADRMINSLIAQEDLDSEMTVVRNEFEANENNSIGVLLNRVLSTAYIWHNYGDTPIGSRSDIENVPIDRLQAFYRKHYQPDNAILVVAGRIEEAKTLGLIAKYFGPIPRPERVLEEYYTVEPVQDGERSVTVRRVGDIQVVMAGFHTANGTHEDFVPLQIAARVLTDEPSGRAYKTLVETGLAVQVAGQALQMKDPGMLLLIAIVRADASLDAARDALLATIDDIRANPITAEEVERAKNRVLAAFELQMNNSQAVALQLSNWAAIGDWRMLFLDRDRVREVSAEAAHRAAVNYLKPSNRTIGLFIPDAAPDRVDTPATDIAVTAALLEGYRGDATRSEGEEFDATIENIEARTQRVELPGGVKLVMLPKETRGDSVQALIRLNTGDERSLRGSGRVGNLIPQMLTRGTLSKTRQQIQDELSNRQSQLNVGGGPNTVVANIQTTREHLAAVLELAIEVLREPAFPESELTTLRDLMLTQLEFTRSEPQGVVPRAFARHMGQQYDAQDVRYSPTLDEELALVRAVTVESLREFHEQFYGAADAEVVIIGDFDAAEVRQLIGAQLDGWSSQQDYAEVLSPYQEVDPLSEAFETPDKENAFFMAGMPVKMNSDHPDYPALLFGNFMLGQGPASRLFSRIRNTEGLSYGVGSQLQAPAKSDGGMFIVNAISAPQNADRVEASFRDELTKILNDGYTDEEIAVSKSGWAQGRQVARSQDQQLVGMLLGHVHNGRTMAWEADLEAKVMALTSAQIRDAMRRHLDLEAMAFMKGGDFAGASQ
jgi:zinc protease